MITIYTTKSDVHLVGNGCTEFRKGKIAEFIIGTDDKGNTAGCFGTRLPLSQWVAVEHDNFQDDWEKALSVNEETTYKDEFGDDIEYEDEDLTIDDLPSWQSPRQFDFENVAGILYGVFISRDADRIDAIKHKNINIVKCIDIICKYSGNPAVSIVFTASKEVFHEIHREYSNGNVH